MTQAVIATKCDRKTSTQVRVPFVRISGTIETTIGISRAEAGIGIEQFGPVDLARLAAVGPASQRLFPDVDVVLTPTLTHTTPRIGYLSGDLDFETHFERLPQYVGFTPLHNVSGQPSISLPLGRTDDGRPIGVMLSARTGQERLLLELAFELEAAAPFATLG